VKGCTMDDMEPTWLEAFRDGRLTEKVWVRVELFIAKRVVRWYWRHGMHAAAVSWAYKHYGREGGRALLRLS